MTKTSKSRKCKNQQNHKNTKSEKVSKWKIMKVIKKVSKNEVPPKRPKCQINGQNRHFAKSEPPGPAFFQSLGVPRDPILRPKMTWGGSDGEFWHTFSDFHFCILSLFLFLSFSDFIIFSLFLVFSILMIFCFSWFLVNFCCCDDFWVIFVSKLSAPMMTHFISRKGALPLSPLLVVKKWPYFGV